MPQSQSLSDLIKFMPLAKDVSFFAGSPTPILGRQGHLWGWHMCEPRRRAQAIRRDEFGSFRPKEGIGKAYKKSEAFCEDMASN